MLVFFGLEVHRRRAIVGAAEPGGCTGSEEHRVGELRLAGSALAYDGDSSKPSDFLHSHSDYLSRCPEGAAPIRERHASKQYFVHLPNCLIVRSLDAHLARDNPLDPLSDV